MNLALMRNLQEVLRISPERGENLYTCVRKQPLLSILLFYLNIHLLIQLQIQSFGENLSDLACFQIHLSERPTAFNTKLGFDIIPAGLCAQGIVKIICKAVLLDFKEVQMACNLAFEQVVDVKARTGLPGSLFGPSGKVQQAWR